MSSADVRNGDWGDINYQLELKGQVEVCLGQRLKLAEQEVCIREQVERTGPHQQENRCHKLKKTVGLSANYQCTLYNNFYVVLN